MLSSPSTLLGEALGLHPAQGHFLVPSWSLGKPGSLASPPPTLEERVSPPPPIFGSATAATSAFLLLQGRASQESLPPNTPTHSRRAGRPPGAPGGGLPGAVQVL